jgi:homoserine dehydrogenase
MVNKSNPVRVLVMGFGNMGASLVTAYHNFKAALKTTNPNTN